MLHEEDMDRINRALLRIYDNTMRAAACIAQAWPPDAWPPGMRPEDARRRRGRLGRRRRRMMTGRRHD